ncbi:23S rRNA (pseudouridine(1915)-N(3))-methyltransferase RlmH [endosymbiont 'TC1' of Trimyema compressum]|uniref:23S rRNA (pseudouridine(1915)-N(3))-methyltransferase RlmH n=1 Tax=endosymbiont 'TC1' of Trimyema compressum TaxID=243899 RepID=UPI0007F174A0|nr:23S rRNA (pseudouridine(1915)-N(3))-methyltransferase RlmH [endosymbiont 'TC1' of Trimyema compressum]AMP20671.1 23S rRNA (pseudouridine(1915)-N(3))-methyltransferase RlmH [endosymbiont 'TC1' of Trimyema compressum]
MDVTFLCVGNLKESYFRDGVKEYEKRLSRFAKINIIEVSEVQIPNNASVSDEYKIMDKEGQLILSKLPKDCYIFVLDRKGNFLSSEELAGKIEEIMTYGKSRIVFIIGGYLGLSDEIKRKAQCPLSFSKMTFPHQLMRLVLCEQVYRGFKIMNHETYHK